MIVSASPAKQYQGKLTIWWDRLQTLPWWGQCTLLWLAMMVLLTIVGLFAAKFIDPEHGIEHGCLPWLGIPPDTIPGIWSRWDSGYYLTLARDGYVIHPGSMGFFPLYPMLMAGLARVTGLSLAMSGMLIAQASYLVAILFFYKLARLVRDDHAYALRCVLFMILFPSSFFFFAIYAESLSLAFSIVAIYLVLRTRPLYAQSGLALGLASAARPVGWLLNIVLLVEFIKRRKFNLSSLFFLGVGGVLSISSVILFVLYLYSITGSFAAIPQAQAEWQRQWQYPWITLGKSIQIAITGNGLSDDWFLYAINWVDLSFTILALSLTAWAIWWSFRQRFRWSLSLYLAISLIFLMAQQGVELVPLWGMTRWVAALFPLYLIMGDLSKKKFVQAGIAFASAGLLLFFTAWWISGRWVG